MAEYAAYATIAAAAASVYTAVTAKTPTMPGVPPPPPGAPPSMQSPQIIQAGDMAAKRAAMAGGIMSNIKTSAQGITGAATTTGKQLLGV